MSKICPKCSADTQPLEEESKEFCIHEKIGIASVGLVLIATSLMAAGII